MNPALGHPHDIRREPRRQSKRRLQINLERPQIPRIHSNQIESRIQCPLQLVAIVHFTQDIEPMPSRSSRKRTQLLSRQRRHNQQHRIRAIRPRFHQLKLIDDEVLAQTGNRDRRRSFPQISQRSLKEFFISQHRQRRRTCRFQLRANSAG